MALPYLSGPELRFDSQVWVTFQLDHPVVDREVCATSGVENYFGQATKGTWGMSWRWKTFIGVEGCEKPGGAVKQALIPGFLT